MKEPKDLIFGGKDFPWQAGIAKSPYLGFADMQNVLIDEKPGALTLQFAATKQSSTTISGLPKKTVINPVNGDLWTIDSDGKVYTSTDDGASWSLVTGNTLGSGQGLDIWKGYLFAFRASAIDVYGPLASSPSWSNSWQSVDTADFHPTVLTQDDKLTFGAGRYVGTIQEVSGQTFAPGTGGTYTFTAQKLTLPAVYKVRCMAQLGLDLKIGTWIGPNLYDVKGAAIFAWDRVSASYAGSRTIFMRENGVNQMLAAEGVLYFTAGVRQTLYATLGGVPQFLTDWKSIAFVAGGNLDPQFDAIAFHKGKVLVGMCAGAGASPLGVYAHDTRTHANTLLNILSTGSSASSTKIGTIFSVTDEVYIVGWQQGAAQGMDMVANNGYRAASYIGYVDTPLVMVGTPNNKRSFGTVDLLFGRDLASAQGCRLKWRQSLDDAFTTLGTFDFSTYGATGEITGNASIPDVTRLQLRIELTVGSSATDTPELMTVMLR